MIVRSDAEPVFKKRAAKRQNIRKKPEEKSTADDEETDVAIDRSKKNRAAGLTASTGATRSSDELHATVGVIESTRELVAHQYGGGAEAENELERNTNHTGNKYTGTQGPVRAPAFLRSTIRVDYQPDICKDYRDTGFCGYGDQCKFLHDRGDYKAGWQIDKEWEELQQKKRKRVAEGLPEDGDEEENKYVIDTDDDLPFACFICKNDFSNPVVTQCGHYFCSQCALDRHRKNPKCAACGKQTFGIFNRASKLIAKLKARERLAGETTGADEFSEFEQLG